MSGSDADAQLAALDAAIAAQPDNADLHYHRAATLMRLARTDDARQAYMAALARQAGHFGALTDLGALLYATDFRSAARLVYAEAVRHHPDNPVARINLANALFANGELDDARRHYEAALGLAPDHPDAHQGLANLLQHLGDSEAAEGHRRRSYGARELIHAPYHGEGEPCRVLVLASAAGGNVPTRFILEPDRVETWTLAVEAFTPETRLPAHDLVFNSVGDADLAPGALQAAGRVLAHTDAPVINPPARVLRTDRMTVARRLAFVPGVVAPRIDKVARADLEAAAAAFAYPLLLRSPGYHTGQHFRKVDRAEDLCTAAAALPGAELLIIQYLDARDASGRSRKYRVMMIGGALFPLHLAVSDDWKVHYFTAAMADQAAYRVEEQRFLTDMPGVLGAGAMAALAAIQNTLCLDYAGIDFGLAPDGRVLLFEANATMVVNPPGPEPMWDYRRAPTDRILHAARALITRGRPARC